MGLCFENQSEEEISGSVNTASFVLHVRRKKKKSQTQSRGQKVFHKTEMKSKEIKVGASR